MARLEQIFFSVIIPVHNKAPYLHAALECLRRQTFRDFEIIVIDDNSQDGSAELLSKYAKKPGIRVLTRDRPGPGGYEARNLGAINAKGEWLAFFDADDYLYSHHLQSFYDKICENPDVSLLVNGYEFVSGGYRIEKCDITKRGLLSRSQALRLMAHSDLLHMNSVCLSRHFFMQTGGFPEGQFKRGGDVYFWVKALTRSKQVFYSPDITSSWLFDHSDVTKNIENLTTHPLSVYFKNEDCGGLPYRDVQIVKRIVNRKIILWAKHKWQLGLPLKRDFAALQYSALSAKQAVLVFRLALPFNTFGIKKLFLRRSRS